MAMIIMVGSVFAALAGTREFVGQVKPPTGRAWSLLAFWFWLLGVACGTGVMVGILGLTYSG